MGDALEVLERLPDASLALRLSAPSRSLAQGAPRQEADDQSRPARPDRRQARAGRRIPARHRRSGLLPLGDDGDGRAAAISNGWPKAPRDFLVRPGGWPETRYEAKARREGREVWYFRYRRVLGSAARRGRASCRTAPATADLRHGREGTGQHLPEMRRADAQRRRIRRRAAESCSVCGLFLVVVHGRDRSRRRRRPCSARRGVADGSTFTGTAEQARMFLGLFGLVIVFGAGRRPPTASTCSSPGGRAGSSSSSRWPRRGSDRPRLRRHPQRSGGRAADGPTA